MDPGYRVGATLPSVLRCDTAPPVTNVVTTQEEFHCGGHTFFIDIALPDLKIAIEFDCRIKYEDSVEEVHESIEAEQRRARLLQLAGWQIIRIRWSDLRRLDEVVAQVLVAIRRRAGHYIMRRLHRCHELF